MALSGVQVNTKLLPGLCKQLNPNTLQKGVMFVGIGESHRLSES